MTPNDFASLEEVEQRLLLYEGLSNREPRPFDWRFDRAALQEFLGRLEARATACPRLWLSDRSVVLQSITPNLTANCEKDH